MAKSSSLPTKLAAIVGALLLLSVLFIAAAAGAFGGAAGTGRADCAPVGSPATGIAGYGAEQLNNAATIVAVGRQLNVPDQGWVVAVAAAMQESGLRNLDHGDRDSLGLFQQRPSQGWGTPDQIVNPTYAATQFYQHLLAVPDWQQMSVAAAAQAVQRSAYPDAYARHESAARLIVAALHDGLTCTSTAAGPVRTDWPPEQATVPDPTSTGSITPRTHTLLRALQERGTTGQGITCFGHRPDNPDSDHPKGRACDIMFNPHDPESVAAGSAIANWLVANQAQFGIHYLIWQGQYWSASNPRWVTYTSTAYGCPNPANLTGCHYDHVHISVF
jgi:hypothetical protein